MKKEIYKGWEIDLIPNEYGFYEAFDTNDCDASMIFSKTIEGVKTQIDETYM